MTCTVALGLVPLFCLGDSRDGFANGPGASRNTAVGQIQRDDRSRSRIEMRSEKPAARPNPAVPPLSGFEFQFARLVYLENPDYSRGWGWGIPRWATDAPEAEWHLLQGIRRLTRVHASKEGTALRLTDDAIFDHPFLYAVEVGGWYLSDQEAKRLREYLDRGGFLMVDDFHGSVEWEGFMTAMRRVYPDRPVVDLPVSAEVFHVLYDLVDRPQIPNVYNASSGGPTWERDGYTPQWRGIYDANGRLVVAINFNMDLGDAWEHADNPSYPEPLTALAYRYAINYLIYSMTH